MKVNKSTPLVLYLLKHDIAFISDREDLVIDDKDYEILLKKLTPAKKRKFQINAIQVPPVVKPEIKVPLEVKTRKREVYRRVIPDPPRKIERPPAVYSNPDYKNMYL